ncbi:MAG: sulfotransferase domain-containing protein [Candidatus Aminicenantes bacterium]|nr:MAG: sulfotransferase domain-containing protein [Candidatus Aminicenantes bacterium]
MDNGTKQEVAPLVLQNGIIVAGHPRSGTSLACKLLESAGVHFPSDLGSDQYNKDGYFELSSAKELEKELIEHAMTEKNILELNKVVKILNETKGLTGLKIVHIPSLFFYKHIAKNIRVVFIFRNPADVKASMLRRGISQFKLSWFDNNNALVAARENIPKSIVVSYETLMEGKKDFKKAFKKLGFTVKTGVIKQGHRTQKNSGIILTEDEKQLYKYLKKLEYQSFK